MLFLEIHIRILKKRDFQYEQGVQGLTGFTGFQGVQGDKGQKGEAAETEAVCGQDEVLAIASGVEHMVRLAQQTQSCEIRTSPLPWHSQQAVYCIVPKGTGSPRSLAAQHRAGRNGPQDEERSSAN